MSFDTVLRIKRKRTDESLTMLVTSDETLPGGKKRRVWQLSRSSDSRGIPVPIVTAKAPVLPTFADEEMPDAPSPPRFSVKRPRSSTIVHPAKKIQRILDLEREEKKPAKPEGEAPQVMADNDILNSMLNEYLCANDLTQSSSSSIEEDFVYDIYYPQATTQAIDNAKAAVLSNYGLLEHFDWDASNNLVVDDDDKDSEGYDSDDSNAEDYVGNDYPDEEGDVGSEGSADSFDIQNSDSENDETYDRSDWD